MARYAIVIASEAKQSSARRKARQAKKRGVRCGFHAFLFARFARAGLLRRFASRNDGKRVARMEQSESGILIAVSAPDYATADAKHRRS
jgi:hypothetical protein